MPITTIDQNNPYVQKYGGLTVSADLANQLAQQQMNANMVGQDLFGGMSPPSEGDNLLDFLSNLHFGGSNVFGQSNSQWASDLAEMNGIPRADFGSLMGQVNDATSKGTSMFSKDFFRGLWDMWSHDYLLQAAVGMAGVGLSSPAGATLGGNGTALAGAVPGSTAGGVGGTTGSFINDAGEMVVTGAAGAAPQLGGVLGSTLANIGAIASGTAPASTYQPNTGVYDQNSSLGGVMTGPNPQGPISSTGAPIESSSNGLGAPIAGGVGAGVTSTVPQEPIDEMTVTGQRPPSTGVDPGTVVGGAGAAVGAGGLIDQGNQGPPQSNNNGAGMSWLNDLADILSPILGGVAQGNAANNAANTMADTSQKQLDFLKESRDMAVSQNAPFLNASYGALGNLLDMTGQSRQGVFSQDQLASNPGLGTASNPQAILQSDPGYQFRMDEGQRALENSAAAKGNLLSGGFAKDLLKYGQDYASNEYTNLYNRISNIAGFGQVASQTNAGVLGQYGNSGAQVIGEQGANSAYGQLGRGNVLSNVIGELGGLNWGNIFNRGGKP